MLPYLLATVSLLPLLVSSQYAVGPSFGGCGGCGIPMPPPPCAPPPRPMCPPPPIPYCPQPPPCPPQFCPPPPICPPPPPPLPCPPPPPPPSCPCSGPRPMPFYPQYAMYRPAPMPYPAYGGGGCGGASYAPMPVPSQNDCCCGCSSPCRYKSRRRAAAFGSKTVDPSCNNEKLRDIITQNIMSDGSESKRAIQKAAEDQLGYMVNVICGRGEFSYVAHTESFCQTTKDEITCYAFRPF